MQERHQGFEQNPAHADTSSSPRAACARGRGYVAAALLVAGCQTVPPPAPKPAPTPRRRRHARAVHPRGVERPAGLERDPVAAAWPAFVVGCRALVANATTARDLAGAVRRRRDRVDGRDARRGARILRRAILAHTA